MSKAVLLPTLLALASTGIALGLWISQPEDSSHRVLELEAKLREAQATIKRLQKSGGGESGALLAVKLAPGSVSPTSGNTYSPLPSGAFNQTAAEAPAPQSQPPADALASSQAAPSPPPQDARTMKRLAEAEARYSDLINQFQLAPDEKEFFKQLAARRSDIRRETATKLQDPTLTPAERQAIYAAALQQINASDGEVRQFLNNDSDFQKFLGWEQTGVERGQVEVGRAIFDNNQASLSPDQEAWLLQSLLNFRKDSHGLADPFDLKSLSGTRVDQTYIRNILTKYDRDTQVLLQDARSRMNQAQLESLAAFRKQLRVQTESRLWSMARTTSS